MHKTQGLETAKRTGQNVQDFCNRLRNLCPDIEVVVGDEYQSEKHNPRGGPIDVPREQLEHRHKWLTCMDEFVDFIQNVDLPFRLPDPVTIALIDGGVDINEQSLHAKIIVGRSFGLESRYKMLNKPYCVSSGGHGTVMASLICRVCPKAQ